MKVLHFKRTVSLFITSIFLTILTTSSILLADSNSDFLNYINLERWDYQNVLVLGVDADWTSEEYQYIKENCHFDKVIILSEGNKNVDYIKAMIAKLGISLTTVGKFDDLKGKNIKNLFAHSWGSSETVNFLSMDETVKVGTLHCMGSPESVAFSYPLKNSFEKRIINKVLFHVNDGDLVAMIRHFPKFTTWGGFGNNIEFHFYTKKNKSLDTQTKEPFTIPIFNVILEYKKVYHHNCPSDGHSLPSGYFMNFNYIFTRDPKNSPFSSKEILPFLNVPNSIPHNKTNDAETGGSQNYNLRVPSYFVFPDDKNPGKSINEAKTLTETIRDKHKTIILGSGLEADLMYKDMVNKLGVKNVKRIYETMNDAQLQKEARKFDADVILGVRSTKVAEALQNHDSNKYNGVDVSPNPVKIGQGGKAMQNKVIKSRPSKDALSWPVE